MNKQKGNSVIGIIAIIAIALLAGIFIGAKTDIINYEIEDTLSELNTRNSVVDTAEVVAEESQVDQVMMLEDDKMEKEESQG